MLLGLMQTTNPLQSGPLGILAVFILLYIVFLGLIALLFFFLSKVYVKFSKLIRTRRPSTALSSLQSYYYGSVVALAPVMLIAMGSVGKVGVREGLLVLFFEIIACVYVRQRLIGSV